MLSPVLGAMAAQAEFPSGTVALETTVIGSFPKPGYLTIPDWFAKGGDKKGLLGTSTSDYSKFLSGMSEEEGGRLEQDIMRATKEVIEEQCGCGVDVVTDGEIRRENYIHFLCRHIDGIDFSNLTETAVRNGAFVAKIPTIVGKVSWRGGLNCAEEWKKAQAVSAAPVKYTLPGPMTIMGSTCNVHYKEEEEQLAFDLAAIVNGQVRELVAAGCKHIQVDEPLFARKPEETLSYGVRALEKCFEGCPPEVEKSMHMCCGYPGCVDQLDYKKAELSAYFKIAPALDESCLDAVSIEDAWCKNDLTLLELFKKTKVIFGTMNVSSSRVETVEEMRERLEEALKHICPERLIVAPDCGLALLDGERYRAKLNQKLANMCAAAKCVRLPCKRKAGTDAGEPESKAARVEGGNGEAGAA